MKLFNGNASAAFAILKPLKNILFYFILPGVIHGKYLSYFTPGNPWEKNFSQFGSAVFPAIAFN